MEKCKLCKTNNADCKGSHIIPHFLLRRVENIEGKTGRGYELGFTITASNVKSHFGQSVLPEKLHEVYGKLSDDEINENHNPSIVDNYFCTNCEKRLAKIESSYSQFVDKDSTSSSSLGCLFWMTVLWRMSIHATYGMKLKNSDVELCRSYINSHIDNIATNNTEQAAKDKRARRISYQLIKCDKDCVLDSSFIHFCLNIENPYILFIGEYILLLSLKNNWNGENILRKQFGINILMNNDYKNRIVDDNECRFILSSEQYSIIQQSFVKKMSSVRMQGIIDLLDDFHKEITNTNDCMPIELKEEIISNMTLGDFSARNWTHQHLTNAIKKVFIEREYINSENG